MDSLTELYSESAKYYNQFLKEIISAFSKSLDNTLNDSRANLIELCYLKAASFSSWHQILDKNKCLEIYNELQSDLSASICCSVTGNYRLALMSIRSFIELSCLFTYYYYHPLEYQWWQNDKHTIKFSDLNQNYFVNYHQLESYQVNKLIYSEWKKVSKYVHAEFKSYMQSSDKLPFIPIYEKGKLGQWITHFSKATNYINQLFYIIFQDNYFEANSKIELRNACYIIKSNLDEDFLIKLKNLEFSKMYYDFL